jgi:hypothetical protein
MNAYILQCSAPHAWWSSRTGRLITILFTDQYGHWTRDTGPLHCIQWIPPCECSLTFAGPN